jgi:hypothetical protein
MGKSEGLTMNRGEIARLQVMGIFTLCGLLVTLGWGRVTSMLVISAKAWTTKPPKENSDASTSTEGLGNNNVTRQFKPTMLSFRDERARWEWPRRTVSLGRRARRTRAWGIQERQASWGECNGQREWKTASLPRRMEEV